MTVTSRPRVPGPTLRTMVRVLRNPHVEGMLIVQDDGGKLWWVKVADGLDAWQRRHPWTRDLTGQVPDPDTLLTETLAAIGYPVRDNRNIPDKRK